MVPWISATKDGSFVLRPAPTSQKETLKEDLMASFDRETDDLRFLEAFINVLTYLKDTFATPHDLSTIFAPGSGPYSEVLLARQRRKTARRQWQEWRKHRPPRFEHPEGARRGTKTKAQYHKHRFTCFLRAKEQYFRDIDENLENLTLEFWEDEARIRTDKELDDYEISFARKLLLDIPEDLRDRYLCFIESEAYLNYQRVLHDYDVPL